MSVQPSRWMSRRWGVAIIGCIALLLALGAWIWLITLSNSRLRLEREHGLRLPASADDIQCWGDGWAVLDRTAFAFFTLDESDLDALTSQLKVRKVVEASAAGGYAVADRAGALRVPEFRGVDQRVTLRSADDAVPLRWYECDSLTDGDVMVVLLHRAEGRILVEVVTDWD